MAQNQLNTMKSFDCDSISNSIKGRIRSLENDAVRAFAPVQGLDPSPFPIAMYAFATIDCLSSYWAGWNDGKIRDAKRIKGLFINDGRSQTKRIADFLESFLGYQQLNSQIATAIWRHKLMHTAEPRRLRSGADLYHWCIGHDIGAITNKLRSERLIAESTKISHWSTCKVGGSIAEYLFIMSVQDLITDLRRGVLGSNGYLERLMNSRELQTNCVEFSDECDSYQFNPI